MNNLVNYKKIKLSNGLVVNYSKMSNATKTFAAVVVKYGSIDTNVSVDGVTNQFNHGVAHFLEHKMFDKEDGDVFQKFVELGTSEVNAYTSFDRTVYHISFIQDEEKNLQLLVDFVFTPYFTDEKTQKEKGIIEQEVDMYNDQSSWNIYLASLRNAYEKSNIVNNILGEKSDIQKITTEELQLVHELFYNTQNSELVVVGKMEEDELVNHLEKIIKNVKFNTPRENVQPIYEAEPVKVKIEQAELIQDISESKIAQIIKLQPQSTITQSLIQYWALNIALKVILGSSSKVRSNLIETNIISEDFSFYIDTSDNYAYILFEGTSINPQKVDINQIIQDNMQVIKQNYSHYQKVEIGKYIMGLDKRRVVANELIDSIIGEFDPKLAYTTLENISLQEIEQVLNDTDFNNMSVLHVKGK
jgi:predicted Zn-dependent peptidase